MLSSQHQKPRKSSCQVTLAQELRTCEDILSGRGFKNFLLCQIWSKLVYMVPVYVALSLVRAARTAGLSDFLDCLCGLLAQYSGGTATLFLAFRRNQMVQFIGHVRVLAEQFDVENGPAHQQVTELPARWMWRARFLATSWVSMGAVLIMLQVTLAKPPVPTLPDLSDGPFWPITAVLEFVKWVFCGGCFFTLWMLVTMSATSLVGLYLSLGERAGRTAGTQGVRALLRQHQRLCQVEDEMTQLLYRFLLHYMFAVGVVPLVNTLQMLQMRDTPLSAIACIQGSANLLSLMTFSTLPATIGSFSLLGDLLTSRSEAVALAVYSAPWPREAAGARRMRQLLIARALRSRGSLSMIGFGPFSLISALAYLRTWYSYLQLLLKASRKWS